VLTLSFNDYFIQSEKYDIRIRMGNQQILLLTLTTVLIGIAVAVGLSMVKDYESDSIISEVEEHVGQIALDITMFYEKPTSLGGGGRTFTGYTLPFSMASTPNATYKTGMAREGVPKIMISAIVPRRDKIGILDLVLTGGSLTGSVAGGGPLQYVATGRGLFKSVNMSNVIPKKR
jgi:hypothetical protein